MVMQLKSLAAVITSMLKAELKDLHVCSDGSQAGTMLILQSQVFEGGFPQEHVTFCSLFQKSNVALKYKIHNCVEVYILISCKLPDSK
jgi:hypothetical protein